MTSASYPGELTREQVRSARGWLAWSQKELAEQAGVATSTVADFERGQRQPIPANIQALRAALEKGGARFLPDGGVTAPMPPTAPRSKRPGMPVRWVEAQDLTDWANRVDAAFTLPTLVAHLASASLGQDVLVRFPSRESVRRPGWDGWTETEVAGHRYVPHGKAGWELTAQREGIKAKATADYDKRTAASDVDREQCTFVFVTLHLWPEKERWVKERKKTGPWRDVRVYDAADLVHWIERTPAVGLWLATLLGKRPQGVRVLGEMWDDWAHATKWPLTTQLVLCDRDEEAVAVQRWLRGEPSVLSLQATAADEVVAFVHAVLTEMPKELGDAYRTRCLVATNGDAARELADAPAGLYILLEDPEPGLAHRLVKQGHYVLLAYGERPGTNDDVRVLPRPSRDEIAKALAVAGIAESAAERYARDCARNLTVLRRLIPAQVGDAPRWAEAPPRALLAALLAGAWDAQGEGDRELLAELTGESYAAVEAVLTSFVDSFGQRSFGNVDQPIKKVGSIWRVASPYDAWFRVARFLTSADLDRFQAGALKVLRSTDPRVHIEPGERWLAGVRGIQPEYSAILRHGIGQALIVLALWGDEARTVHDAKRRAEAVVEGVLHDADGARWWSLAQDFRLLAEASPDAFLTAIEESLDKSEPPIRALLDTHEGGLFGTEYLSNLMWALETLAWSPDWLLRVTRVLARLETLDTRPGRHANRPINSLRQIYCLWNPQSYAPLEDRLRVIAATRKNHNEVAWKLMLALLPSGHEISLPSPMPRWRDFSIEEPEVLTHALFWQGATKIGEWLTADAGVSVKRWSELLARFGDLAPNCKQAVAQLANAVELIVEPEDRAALWGALRHELHRHREFPDAEWSLKADVLEPLEAIYRKLTPADMLQRVAWLFEQGPQLPDPPGDGWEAQERAVDAARRTVAHALLAEGGIPKVLALAGMIETAGFIGKALYDSGLTDPDLDALLAAALRSEDVRVRRLAHGLIVTAFQDRKEAWAEKLIAEARNGSLGDAAAITVLRALPMRRWTWDQAAKAGQEVEDAYWKQASPYLASQAADDVVFAIRKLILVGRARDALPLASRVNKHDAPPDLLILILQESLRQLVEVGGDSNSSTMFQHYVADVFMQLDKCENVDNETIVGLEWGYLPVLRHSRRPARRIMRALSEQPTLFVDLLKLMYRPGKDSGVIEPESEDRELATANATQAFHLLRDWNRVPGTREDGTIDHARLADWINKARALANEVGRVHFADHQIGEVLSASPMGQDSVWPAEAVREVLDLFASKEMLGGFRAGKLNRRGVTSRDGELARQEAAKYRAWAKAIRFDHPHTAKALHAIADSYDRDARRHDESAERDDWE